jgi:hypothetical protein
MKKTTLYLPDELKRQIEAAAEIERRPEADVIREALEVAMRNRVPPEPRLPLFTAGVMPPDLAEKVDEYLRGFGE